MGTRGFGQSRRLWVVFMRGQFGRLGEERGFFPREGLERVHLETRGVDKEGGREGGRRGSESAERKVD